LPEGDRARPQPQRLGYLLEQAVEIFEAKKASISAISASVCATNGALKKSPF